MCALLQVLTFLSFKEKKENRLAEALSETVHSPLFTLRLYANSVQKRTKRGLLIRSKGLKLRLCAKNFSSCFTSNWGFALCCFTSNYGYVLPLFPALPCSNLPLVYVRDLRLIISTLLFSKVLCWAKNGQRNIHSWNPLQCCLSPFFALLHNKLNA